MRGASEPFCLHLQEAVATSTSAATPKRDAAGNMQLPNYDTLLQRLEEYVENVRKSGEAVDRKLLDTLLGAINVQVQKEPYSVRKLILDKQLVLPNSIMFPPSQVCAALVFGKLSVAANRASGTSCASEQTCERCHRTFRLLISSLSTTRTRRSRASSRKAYGEERPRLSDAEKRDRAHLKASYPAPAMTRSLIDIGQDLVQETTYCDIVHARNLPEMPKNIETYKQVRAARCALFRLTAIALTLYVNARRHPLCRWPHS